MPPRGTPLPAAPGRWAGPALVAAACALVLAGAACARQGAPPGGPEDRRPPVVVRTEPDTFAVLESFDGAVRFVFDERISERVTGGLLEDAVVVTPETGEVRVETGRRDVSVTVEGGWRPGLVYRVQLLPVVSDLFGNRLRDPFEIVFSTGGELTPNAVAGVAWDRITRQAVDQARVELVADGDTSTVHVARTDTGGIYVFRYVPPGRYALRAFLDLNRSGDPDGSDPVGTLRLSLGERDTVFADVPLLAPDTTPASLTRVTALDSLTLVLQLSHYLDPAAPVTSVDVTVEPADSASPGLASPGVRSVEQVWRYENRVDALADSFARLDSIEAAEAAERAASAPGTVAPPDTAAVDSVAAAAPPRGEGDVRGAGPPADTVPRPARVLPPRIPDAPSREVRERAGEAGEAAFGFVSRDGPPPDRRLVVVLDRPLVPGEPYVVRVDDVRTIHGVPSGGGEAGVLLPLPPPPDTTTVPPPDTTAVPPPDTLPGGADTAGVAPPDTVPPDTVGLPDPAAAAAASRGPTWLPAVRRREGRP